MLIKHPEDSTELFNSSICAKDGEKYLLPGQTAPREFKPPVSQEHTVFIIQPRERRKKTSKQKKTHLKNHPYMQQGFEFFHVYIGEEGKI